MTPRQAAIHAHFMQQDKAVDEVRLLRVMQLAFGGNQEAFDEWRETLGLPDS